MFLKQKYIVKANEYFIHDRREVKVFSHCKNKDLNYSVKNVTLSNSLIINHIFLS